MQTFTVAPPSVKLNGGESSVARHSAAAEPTAAKLVQQQAPAGAAAPNQPVGVITGVVSTLIQSFLNPLAASNTGGAPADTPALWSLLAFARREFETALGSASVADASANAATTAQTLAADTQAPDLQVQAVGNTLTYTAPPTLYDQAIVLGLRVLHEVSRVIGVNLFFLIGVVTQSEDPPFFLTFGLNAQQTEYEVSPGNVWKVWELTPPNPTGKTVIGIHGGGFTLQPSLPHWLDYTSMARDTGATVVVPIYPLATTEAGTALEVIPDTANFISHEIDVHGAENVSLYGDSAGYTIAISAVRQLILNGEPLPASMVLLSGAADFSMTNPDVQTIDDPTFDPGSVDFAHWFDGITDLKDPFVSPLFFEPDVLTALPPTTIYVGSLELVLPDNLLLYQRAADLGAPISLVVGQGLIHDWPLSGLPINSSAPVVRPDIYRQLGLLSGTSGGAQPAAQPEQRTLVLSAFPAEADAILARTTLDPNPTVVVDGHHFYLGTLGGKKVIVAMTGIGMVNATDATETALDHFAAESGISVGAVVFSGVAGGSGRTEIGDVAVPARWTADDGTTWHAVDPGMLAAANSLDLDLLSSDSVGDPACYCGLFAGPVIDLNREPELFVGGDGSSDDNNNGTAFPSIPSIPLAADIFGPQPCSAPDFSLLFTGNLFQALVPFLTFGLLSNVTGFFTNVNPPVDAVDQETAAAQQVADAHGIPFLGIRGMSDGPGDPLHLPGYPFTFVVYKQIAADNAAIVTEAFLQNWSGA